MRFLVNSLTMVATLWLGTSVVNGQVAWPVYELQCCLR
jgi:protein gp37